MNFSAGNFFKTIDQMDATHFADYFHPDGKFIFGNNPPSVGKVAIAETAQSVFSVLKAIDHETIHHWDLNGTHCFEGLCTYHKLDGQKIRLPYMAIAETTEGLIQSYRTYIDPSPLFST